MMDQRQEATDRMSDGQERTRFGGFFVAWKKPAGAWSCRRRRSQPPGDLGRTRRGIDSHPQAYGVLNRYDHAEGVVRRPVAMKWVEPHSVTHSRPSRVKRARTLQK